MIKKREKMLLKLADRHLTHILRQVFSHLTYQDIWSCLQVSMGWRSVVKSHVMSAWDRAERSRFGWLACPTKTEKIDLSDFLGQEDCDETAVRKVWTTVLDNGEEREVRETTFTGLLVSLDGEHLAIITEKSSTERRPHLEVRIGIYGGQGLVATLRPTVPRGSRPRSSTLDYQFLVMANLVVLWMEHGVVWTFRKDDGMEILVVRRRRWRVLQAHFAVSRDQLTLVVMKGASLTLRVVDPTRGVLEKVADFRLDWDVVGRLQPPNCLQFVYASRHCWVVETCGDQASMHLVLPLHRWVTDTS